MLVQTLFIYSSLILVLLVNGLYIEQKSRTVTLTGKPFTNKVFLSSSIFMFVYFAVLVGMRYGFGTDHLHYWDAYEYGGNERFELLFWLLSKTCNSIGLHPTVYFGILGLIQITLLYFAFKDESYLFPLFAIFLFTDGIFASWMNTIRQDIACCIWIFGFKYIIQKKPIPYLLTCLIAFLFHRSAIVLVALYPIFKNGKDIFHKIPIQVFVIIAAFLFRNSISDLLLMMDTFFSMYSNLVFLGGDSALYSSYSAESAINAIGTRVEDVQNTGVGIIVRYITYFVIVLFSNKTKDYFKSPMVNVFYTLFFISFIAYIVLPLGVWSLSRPFQYLNIIRMAMLSYTVYYLLKNKEGYNSIVAYLIIITQVGMYFTSMIVASQSAFYRGYQLFFQAY